MQWTAINPFGVSYSNVTAEICAVAADLDQALIDSITEWVTDKQEIAESTGAQ